MFTNKQEKNIIFAPLNWGLGHATRSIPIIDLALEKGCEVTIASDGMALRYLERHYPSLRHVELPSLEIHYGGVIPFAVSMAMQIPKIARWVKNDHAAIEEIARAGKIDLIVSDNRWGAWSRLSKSVFITHQLHVKMPLVLKPIEAIAWRTQRLMLRKFDEIWVPDVRDSDKSISGELSHVTWQNNIRYIGAVSRLKAPDKAPGYIYDVAIILSGVEPQRTELERLLLDQLTESTLSIALVRGTERRIDNISDKITVYAFCDSHEIEEVFSKSKLVICRSGYTTIMDLLKLEKRAILIPTPGQTEQEYLGKRMKELGLFDVVEQKNIRRITDEYMAKATMRPRCNPARARSEGISNLDRMFT